MKNKLFSQLRLLFICFMLFAAGAVPVFAQDFNQKIEWSSDPNVLEYKVDVQDKSGKIITYIDHIIVRYNFIHDYSGMASNRGIYLDDGAGNVDIYGNVLVNILNGHAIFSWLSKGAGKKYPSANNNINCMYNIIQGSYKFDEI